MNHSCGELLGYGARHILEARCVRVLILIHDPNNYEIGGSIIAGFLTHSETAENFADARIKDYSDYFRGARISYVIGA